MANCWHRWPALTFGAALRISIDGLGSTEDLPRKLMGGLGSKVWAQRLHHHSRFYSGRLSWNRGFRGTKRRQRLLRYGGKDLRHKKVLRLWHGRRPFLSLVSTHTMHAGLIHQRPSHCAHTSKHPRLAACIRDHNRTAYSIHVHKHTCITCQPRSFGFSQPINQSVSSSDSTLRRLAR